MEADLNKPVFAEIFAAFVLVVKDCGGSVLRVAISAFREFSLVVGLSVAAMACAIVKLQL